MQPLVARALQTADAALLIATRFGGEALPDRMSNEKKPMKTTTGARARTGGKAKSPEWATGLRRLYDSVVEEPLPDSFAQLLDQLDNPPHD